MMKNIAIQRLRILPTAKGEGLTPKHKLVVLSELARLGVRISNPEALDKASPSMLSDHYEVMQTLRKMRGGDVDYVPLFVDFPNDVPDDDEYFAKRIVGYIGNFLHLFDDGVELDNGMVVPEWLFDLRKFGADPISQFQTKSQFEQAKTSIAQREADDHVEWIDVELVWDDEVATRLYGWLENTLYAKSSIKTALHADITTLLSTFGVDDIDLELVTMKENQALLLRLLWAAGREECVAKIAKTPTDLLRMFAALTETDVSLSGPVKFPKMSRKQRRTVLAVLEASSNLAEDLKRYRGLWLALGRYVHPGEHQRAFPKSAAAFDALRNGTISTFDSRTEVLLCGSDVGAVLSHLAKRPGVMARKVHELLRRFSEGTAMIMDAFATVAGKMTVKNLLVLESYFRTINDDEFRTVINKRGKIKVLPNNTKGALSADTLQLVANTLDHALTQALSTKETWHEKTVWIDPQLANYTVPLAQRAASDGLVTVGRGSRIDVQFDKVLRLFVYWKQAIARTDLDLSVIQFDADFAYVGHVSYTNLKSGGIVHSGDLQSAPHGAAEFIDITLDKVDANVRYLATQVYRYSGEAFADMTCHSGWMIRSQVDAAYASFDIKTVANKFDLTGRNGYCIPLVVDLKRQQIVMTDLYMGNKAFHNTVEGAHGNVAMASREIARFTETRPTMKALAELHCKARGGVLVDEAKADADVTFGLGDCTYNVANVEHILSELL